VIPHPSVPPLSVFCVLRRDHYKRGPAESTAEFVVVHSLRVVFRQLFLLMFGCCVEIPQPLRGC